MHIKFVVCGIIAAPDWVEFEFLTKKKGPKTLNQTKTTNYRKLFIFDGVRLNLQPEFFPCRKAATQIKDMFEAVVFKDHAPQVSP